MGSKLWGKLSVLALCSAFVAGCANGPEKDRKVLGAQKGSPPYGTAQTTQPPPPNVFPTAGNPNGTTKVPVLPPIGGGPLAPGGQPTSPVLGGTLPPPQPVGMTPAPITPPAPPAGLGGSTFGENRPVSTNGIPPLPTFPPQKN